MSKFQSYVERHIVRSQLGGRRIASKILAAFASTISMMGTTVMLRGLRRNCLAVVEKRQKQCEQSFKPRLHLRKTERKLPGAPNFTRLGHQASLPAKFDRTLHLADIAKRRASGTLLRVSTTQDYERLLSSLRRE
jgi:hypothetical protein